MGVGIAHLKEFEDCTVILRLTDGEVLKAKIAFVDLEYEDIIVDVLETSLSNTRDLRTPPMR
jgi:hypothetical protein